MEWQPNNEFGTQIITLIRDAASAQSQDAQGRIHAQLNSFHNVPDYNNYLVYIFSKMTSEQEYVRTIAGILLKNNIKDYWDRMQPEVKRYIKQEILSCIGDPKDGIRRALSTIVTTIVTKTVQKTENVEPWPIQNLIQLLDSPDPNTIDGALNTINLICEDSGNRLDTDVAGRPLNALIPKLISFFAAQHDSFRRLALNSLNYFIAEMPNAFLVNINHFLDGLFKLCNDRSAEVRRNVCKALVTLVEVRTDFLQPHIHYVIRYMIHSTRDADETVALEACEFWTSLADTDICKPVLSSYLPELVPLLLNGMCYSEMHRVMLEEEAEEDEQKPDDAKDIKPRFHHSNKVVIESDPNAQQDAQNTSAADDTDFEDEDDDDFDDDDDNDEATEWTLRKCSAAGLDVLSTVYKDELLGILLPLIDEKIRGDQPWWVRESGILAIGAVAEGCINGINQFLPKMIPFLISLLNDPKPLVRCITCWTLSRYSKWVVNQQSEEYLKGMVDLLLQRILDPSKRVQEAACSAFATLEEEAQIELVPYLHPIINTLASAFNKYQAKNLLILYDAVSTLADNVGNALNAPEYVSVLMPPLIQKWQTLDDSDRNLFPLLECLTSIATALGMGFQPFAQPVFVRCLRLIESTLIQNERFQNATPEQRDQMEPADKEFIVCSLDLIAGIAEGMGNSVESLIGGSNLLPILGVCMQDRGADVRQSAFALIGDLAKTCIYHLKPSLNNIIPLLINSLTPEYISVCNNASWALGEIAIKIGEAMKPFVDLAISKLIPTMTRVNLNRNLLENTAITIGRLGLSGPEVIAPRLGEFLKPWCLAIRHIRDDVEKESACRGMCMMIKQNPNGVVESFIFVCDAINSWRYPNEELKAMFYTILHMFKAAFGEGWPQYFEKFPPPLRNSLREKYSL